MNRFLKPVSIAGLAISAVFLVMALWQLQWSEIKDALGSARPWPWIPLAILSYMAGQFVRGARCSFIVRVQSRLPVLTATNVVVVGYAANNVLPARLGELVRAGLLADRAGIPVTQSLAITLLERVLDGWILLLLLAAACLTITVPGWLGSVVLVGVAVFVAATSLILLCVLTPNWMTSFTARVCGLFGDRFRDLSLRLLIRATAGLSCLKSPRNVVYLGFQSLLVWLLEAGMFLLIFPAFGITGNFWWAIWAMTVTNLGIMAPSSPGYIGPFHFFCMKSLTSLGVAKAAAISYAAAVHLAFYIPVTLWGLGAMLRYGVELGATAMRARASRGERRPDLDKLAVRDLADCPRFREIPEKEPGEFVQALTNALLPWNEELDLLVRSDRIRKAAAFTQGQIDALPLHMRAAFRVGRSVFFLLVRLRYLAAFEKLPPARQQAVVEAWAYGPVFIARQLMRPVRICALLAYHEGIAEKNGEKTGEEGGVP